MSYTKQTFTDKSTVLKAEHLNHIEAGIVENEKAIEQKQDTLTAGANISIAGNVISADTGNANSKYAGKVLSILGDSISSFGVPDQANATGTWDYPNNGTWYDETDAKGIGITSIDQIWWKKVMDKLGMLYGMSDSVSGTTIASFASQTRVNHLGLGTTGTPDVIFVFGGTNDLLQAVELGTVPEPTFSSTPNDTEIAAIGTSTFADAYVTMMLRLNKTYPNAKVFYFTPLLSLWTGGNAFQAPSINDMCEIIKTATDIYGGYFVDLRKCGITLANTRSILTGGAIHPNETGHTLIAEYAYNQVLNAYFMPAGTAEQAEFTVTAKYDATRGSVTLSATNGVVGNPVTVTIEPLDDYNIGTVTINGSAVTASESVTFKPVEGENVIAVEFVENTTWYIDNIPTTYVAGTSSVSGFGISLMPSCPIASHVAQYLTGHTINTVSVVATAAGTLTYYKYNSNTAELTQLGAVEITSTAAAGKEIVTFTIPATYLAEYESIALGGNAIGYNCVSISEPTPSGLSGFVKNCGSSASESATQRINWRFGYTVQ